MAYHRDNGEKCLICNDYASVAIWKRQEREGVVVKGPRRDYCTDCYYELEYPKQINRQLKDLKRLVADLREHAYNYILDDGQLTADLHQAANYLEAVANG